MRQRLASRFIDAVNHLLPKIPESAPRAVFLLSPWERSGEGVAPNALGFHFRPNFHWRHSTSHQYHSLMLSRAERLRHDLDTSEKVLELIEFARLLRQTATDAECVLWSCLRDRKMNGCKFRRQHPVRPYVLDFYCHALQLGVEVDGGQHYSDAGLRNDAVRTDYLQRQGIRLLRFTNHDVLTNLEGVLRSIWQATNTQG